MRYYKMVSNLDNLAELRLLDRGEMLGFLGMFPQDCRLAIKLVSEVDLSSLRGRKISSVVFIGMGGSAIGGAIIRDWLLGESKVPMVVSRGSPIPEFVGRDSLVFAVSYSGNTSETLEACEEALAKGATVIAFSSGGSLEMLAEEKSLVRLLMPPGRKPRAAIPYQLLMLAKALQRLDLVPASWDEVEEAVTVLEALREELAPEEALESNPAKRLATDLRLKLPLVWGPRLMEAVSYRFCTQLNENGKTPAGFGTYPEVFHNAVVGSEGPDEVLRSLAIVLIRTEDESQRLSRKLEAFKALFEPRVGGLFEVWARGRGKLARMLSVLYFGDYVATYLGLLKGADPSDDSAIEKLKMV